MSLLHFRISVDYEFLTSTLENVARVDEATREMLNIIEQLHDEGIRQPIGLLMQQTVNYREVTNSIPNIE